MNTIWALVACLPAVGYPQGTLSCHAEVVPITQEQCTAVLHQRETMYAGPIARGDIKYECWHKDVPVWEK